MPLRTPDTQHESDQDSANNPAQQYYDREFNEIAHNLREQEGNALEATHGDGDKEDIQARGTEGLDDIRQSEESGGWDTKVSPRQPKQELTATGKVKETAKKLVPTGVILTLVGGGFLGLGSVGTLPFTIIETFTNDLNDPFSSQYRKHLDVESSLLDGKKEDRDKACEKPTSLACRRVSISPETAKEYEDKGFKLNSKGTTGGRVTFASLAFPNDLGTVDSPSAFKRLVQTSDGAFSALNKVRNFRTDFFNRSNFYSKILNRLGFSKGKQIIGDTKEDAEESYKKATSSEKKDISVQPDKTPEEGSEEEKRRARENNAGSEGIARELNDAASQGRHVSKFSVSLKNGVVSVVQLGCTAYNTVKLSVNLARAEIALRLAKFTYALAAGIQAMKAGAGKAGEAETIMDIISPSSQPAKVFDPTTNRDIDNPWKNKNLTDSEPFQIIALKSKAKLDPIALRTVQGSGTVGVMKSIIDWMHAKLGKKNIRTICKIANNPFSGIIGMISSPVLGLGMELIASFLPMDEIAMAIVNTMVDMLAGLNITTDMKGVLAGYGMFVGFGEIFSAAGTSYGQVPRPFQKIKENMAANNQLIERETTIAKKEASKTPLDASNRYSFLGSLSTNLQLLLPKLQSPSVSSPLSKLLAFPSASLGMLSQNANAAYNMSVSEYSPERFDQCDDTDLKEELNIQPDLICHPRLAPFDEVPSGEAIAYMKQTNQATETGTPVPGSSFERYLEFCANRTDRWGTTSVPLEDQEEAKIGWYTGRNCIPENVDEQTAKENQMASEYIATMKSLDIRDNKSGGGGAGPTVPGDAKGMAMAVANNPNIRFVNPAATKTQLEKFSRGEPTFNECGAPIAPSKYLLSALLTNSSKYSILINNIGFREDRDTRSSGADWDCNFPTRQHPLGTAVDINEIQIIGGAGTGAINFPSGANIASQYATDFLAALPLNRGGVGQNTWVKPNFPAGSIALNGSHSFYDIPNHLHIDARNREDLLNTE